MKIHELKKGDEFEIDYYNESVDEIELTISGIFIKMDGAYAIVNLHGIDEDVNLKGDLEVRKL